MSHSIIFLKVVCCIATEYFIFLHNFRKLWSVFKYMLKYSPQREEKLLFTFLDSSSFDRREGLFSSNCYCKPFWDIKALISKGSNRISWIKHFALFPMTCCTCISAAVFAESPSYRLDTQNNSKCYRHIKFHSTISLENYEA